MEACHKINRKPWKNIHDQHSHASICKMIHCMLFGKWSLVVILPFSLEINCGQCLLKSYLLIRIDGNLWCPSTFQPLLWYQLWQHTIIVILYYARTHTHTHTKSTWTINCIIVIALILSAKQAEASRSIQKFYDYPLLCPPCETPHHTQSKRKRLLNRYNH